MKYLKHPVNIPRHLESIAQKNVIDSTKAWSSFNNKDEIHESLLTAQNYLCAYCEIELIRGEGELGFHIEHIEPKSLYPEHTFKFENLLISCFDTGSELESLVYNQNSISCGHFKKNNFDLELFLNPTNPDCENYFFYELDGRIVPNPKLTDSDKIFKAEYTIKILNLDCRRLNRKRGAIIKQGLKIVNDLLNYSDSLSYFAELELAEIHNKCNSFFITRRQFFQDFKN